MCSLQIVSKCTFNGMHGVSCVVNGWLYIKVKGEVY